MELSPQPVLRLLLCASLLLAAGCHGTAPKKSGRTAAARSTPRSADTQYRIQPNDVLLVTFAESPDYNMQARVDWHGKIDLPALASEGRAELQAAGLTPSQLAEKITEFGRTNKILVAQRAQVFVADFASRTFVVLGQVNIPGRYSFPKGVPAQLDLEEAVAMSGGYTRLARQSLVMVKRGNNVHRVNLRKLSTDAGAGRFLVAPGDVITVAERIF